jgi:hypothetical protein
MSSYIPVHPVSLNSFPEKILISGPRKDLKAGLKAWPGNYLVTKKFEIKGRFEFAPVAGLCFFIIFMLKLNKEMFSGREDYGRSQRKRNKDFSSRRAL